MPDLTSEIARLQSEFQGIANAHPWVSLGIQPRGSDRLYIVGENDGGPEPFSPFSFVRDARHPARRPVIDHVDLLTERAMRLLSSALGGGYGIPPEIALDVQEREQQRCGAGWVRWLQYASIIRNVRRFDNYPQVAATALLTLREQCALHPVAKAESPAETRMPDGRLASANGPRLPDKFVWRDVTACGLKGLQFQLLHALWGDGVPLDGTPIKNLDLTLYPNHRSDNPWQRIKELARRTEKKLAQQGIESIIDRSNGHLRIRLFPEA